MYEFNVVKDVNILRITSNTYWNCSVYGSILLDKTSGVGNDSITISIPNEMSEGYGRVIFTYGDERCDYPALDIYHFNYCYIETDPMFIKENGENVLKLSYNGDNDAVNIKVYANSGWSVSDSVTSYINGNDLIIIPPTGVCSASTTISSNVVDCNNNINVYLYNQNGGSYSKYIGDKHIVTGMSISYFTTGGTGTTFGCDGGSYSVSAYTNYNIYKIYAFVDCCGNIHYDDLKYKTSGETGSEFINAEGGSFDSWDCCEGTHYEDSTVSFSIDGYSQSITFKQECKDCSNSPQCNHCEISGPDTLECEGTQQYTITSNNN